MGSCVSHAPCQRHLKRCVGCLNFDSVALRAHGSCDLPPTIATNSSKQPIGLNQSSLASVQSPLPEVGEGCASDAQHDGAYLAQARCNLILISTSSRFAGENSAKFKV